MKILIKIICTFSIIFAAQSAIACDYPNRASIPNGGTATKEDMLEGQRGVKTYVAAMEVYLECIVDEEIITRPDWNLDTSVADLLESVREYPAFSHGKLEFPIPFELAVGLTCNTCGHSSPIRRKAGEILLSEALCPNRCSVTDPMDPEYIHSVYLEDELSKSSLKDLTFRPLDYIWVKNEESGESLCFEIGGEIGEVFQLRSSF